ncbi:hypothetical protein ABPG75_004459 [Micractinium tetrahymenae]
MSAAPATTDAALLAQAGGLSQGLLGDGGGGSLRAFTFGVDLQRFAAGPRLPLNLAEVALELELPAELAGLIQASNGRLPPRLAPLRTGAVQVARGSEAALPGGRAACDFAAGLMSVATLLARNPVMTIDVYHRQRLADDLLLGRAHVPLAPLLQESWVDGRAGVFALVPSAADPLQHERVQIGTVHLVMSLEEAGPAPVPAPVPATAAAAVPGLAAPPAALPASRPGSAARLQQPAAQAPPAHTAPATAPPSLDPDGFAGPEFEAAWQLELWKREEEAKWRRELQEREAKRMAALEDAWRRREAEREAEAASLRSEYSALEAKARQVLAAAEQREQRLVAAEEAVARRRRELEREHAGRVAEAEAAVRRLQSECQHQLELEAQRREAQAKDKAAAEARAAAAEGRAAASERALQQQREQHSASSAGRMEAELVAVQAELATAEARAAKAAEAKRKYKEQVVRLAQEVAALQQQLAELAGVKRRQLDAELAALAAQEQALAARRDAAELGALKQQLHVLQLGGGGGARDGDGEPIGGDPGGVNGSSAVAAAGGQLGGSLLAAAGAAAGAAPGAAASPGKEAGSGQVLRGQLGDAVQRLLRERELLLGSGAYSAEDPLIAQLDARIRECAALAQRGGG